MGHLGILVNPPLFWGTRRTRLSLFDQVRRSVVTKEAISDFPGEHLGLGSIAAFCRSRGQTVTIVNGIAKEHRSIDETFADIQAAVLADGAPALIGFSGTSLVHAATTSLLQRCKEAWPDARTMLGYDFATLNYDRLLRTDTNIDFICRGEGELVFSTLLDRLVQKKDYTDIPGLAYRDARGQIAANEPIACNLNELPWPARDDLPHVLAAGLGPGVYASRGCPYRCNYCALGASSALLAKESYRLRDVEAVVEEIVFLYRDYGMRNVTIVDDLFVTKSPAAHERAHAFADLLISKQLDLRFMIDCRVDSIEKNLFEHLYRAGLRKIFVGVETPDPEQLAKYNKKYLIKKARPQDRLREAKDIGLEVVPGLLTFHPRSAVKELRRILEFVEDVGWHGKFQLLHRIRAYPGTPLYDEYSRDGLLTVGTWPNEDWVSADPRMDQFVKRVTFEALRPKSTWDDVKAIFRSELDALDAGLEQSPVPLDDAAQAAIAAGLETAGGGAEL
jgi:radical SAM superfamily enzyme YgiQ (UPF0313 family)